jgi:hypothetical protein
MHPWVQEFEKEAKEAKPKSSGFSNGGSGYDYNSKLMSNILDDEVPPTKNNKMVVTSKDFKKNGNEDVKKKKDDNDSIDGIDIDFKPKKKKKKVKKDDIVESVASNDIFDQVLNKVKEKNKGTITH